MIKSTDIISEDLFDKQIKDTLKLAQSLEKLEGDLKSILKTTELLANSDAFKSYDSIKKVETDVTKLETALNGLLLVEDERLKLIKETSPLIVKYKTELEDLTKKTNDLTLKINSFNKASSKEITTLGSLNRLLSENKRRIDVLVNSNRALLSIQTRTTTQTVKNITEYRKLNTEIAKQETINQSLKTDTTTVKTSENKNLKTYVSLLNRLKGAGNSAATSIKKLRDNLLKNDNTIDKSNKNLNRFIKFLNRLKSTVGKTKDTALGGLLFGGAAAIGSKSIDILGDVVTSTRKNAVALERAFENLQSILVKGFNTILKSIPDFTSEKVLKIDGKPISEGVKKELELQLEEINKSIKNDKNKLTLEILTDESLKDLEFVKKQYQEYLDTEGKFNKSFVSFKNFLLRNPQTNNKLFNAMMDFIDDYKIDESDTSKFIAFFLFDRQIELLEDELGTFGSRTFAGVTFERENLSDFIGVNNETNRELLELQLILDKTQKTVVDASIAFEKLEAAQNESSKSLTERIELSQQAEVAEKTLAKAEKEAAAARLNLARRGVQLRLTNVGIKPAQGKNQDETDKLLFNQIVSFPAGGELSQELADAYISALNGITQAEAASNERLRQLRSDRREAISDDLELTLDALRDSADKIKTVNETIINDDRFTVLERRKLFNETRQLLNKSYDDSIKELNEFQKKIILSDSAIPEGLSDIVLKQLIGITNPDELDKKLKELNLSKNIGNFIKEQQTLIQKEQSKITNDVFNDLINETNIFELDKKVREIDFSDILTRQVFDIIKERQQVLSDLRETNLNLIDAELQVGFTERDIVIQKKYLKLLEEQNIELEKAKIQLSTTTSNDEKKQAEDNLKKIIENSSKLQLQQESELLEEQIKQLREKIEAVGKLNKTEIENNKNVTLSKLELEKELNDLLLEQQRQYIEQKRELEEQSLSSTKQTIEKEKVAVSTALQVLNDITDKIYNERLNRVDNEINNLLSREQSLIALAERGSDELTKNLAFEQKKLAELELQRERINRNRERTALALSIVETYNSELSAARSNGDINPAATALSKTAINVSLLQSLLTSLPAFYDGVEDTGSGGNIDNKKGFLAVLHPHERVLTAEQNKKLVGLSNEELVNRVSTINNVLPTQTVNLERKIDELINVTKSKKEYLGSDYDVTRKAVIDTIKTNDNIKRKHSRTDNLF